MKKYLAILLCAALIGCAGTAFKWSDARQLQAGMTTAEVTRIMGKPYSVTAAGEKLIYTWVEVSPFGGTKSLAIVFLDGKVAKAPQIPPEYR